MADDQQPKSRTRILDAAHRELEEKTIMRASQTRSLGYVNIYHFNINPDVLKLISEEDAKEAEIFTFFKTGKKLRIAVINPDNPKTIAIINKLKEQEYEININLVSESSLIEALEQYKNVFKAAPKVIENVIPEGGLNIDLKKSIENDKPTEVVNNIFLKALQDKASDIHFEPEEKKSIIRYRIDGILHTVAEVESEAFHEVIMQIKHQAKLKLNVTARPQDGRTYFIVGGRKIDIRVSCLPSAYGEDIVMRILDSGAKKVTLDDLGFREYAYKQIQKTLDQPHGMVISTGPTGSGKTTTLYTLLQSLNDGERKIITLEDPIEYHLEGITQSQINESENYTFASGLRSILRQDPDIVMVGEIRDKETAEVAAQAALTGHKVLSTLHTNSAVASISRLRNMDVPTFMLASAIELIIGQRLVRKICPHCAQDEAVPVSALKEIEKELPKINQITGQHYEIPKTIKKAVGCSLCGNTGYKGRTGLYETFHIDDTVRQMILNEEIESKIFEYAQSQGMLTMWQDGILKVVEGKTTMEELQRVSQE